MYVDRSYKVTGVGAVASRTVNSGTVEAGDELLLGPMADSSFREVEARSIEMHYHRVDKATAGRIVGIALKGVDESEIERGMALVPRDSDSEPVREFEAEVMVLNHPTRTRIQEGYEPVVHVETVSEAAVFARPPGWAASSRGHRPNDDPVQVPAVPDRGGPAVRLPGVEQRRRDRSGRGVTRELGPTKSRPRPAECTELSRADTPGTDESTGPMRRITTNQQYMQRVNCRDQKGYTVCLIKTNSGGVSSSE